MYVLSFNVLITGERIVDLDAIFTVVSDAFSSLLSCGVFQLRRVNPVFQFYFS